ncbi:MAG: hypothetical protein N2043_02415 [Ignavibacterium sp.]|nr:hypothetical protein [Ignavibacterium sp.]
MLPSLEQIKKEISMEIPKFSIEMLDFFSERQLLGIWFDRCLPKRKKRNRQLTKVNVAYSLWLTEANVRERANLPYISFEDFLKQHSYLF